MGGIPDLIGVGRPGVERSGDRQARKVTHMRIRMDRRLRRRDVLGLLGTGMSGLAAFPASSSARSGATVPVAAQAGVDLLRTFYLFDKLPVPPTSALPGPTWRTFVSASGRLEYSVPPSWSATAPPTWEIENGQVLLTDAMSLVGPQRSAGWITYAGQSLVMGTADDTAGYGLRDVAALLGAKARPTLLSVERTVLLGASITFEVARWGSTLAVVRGGSHVSGIDFVFYDAMAAAAERFTASTRSVFLPLIYEHIGGGGTPVAWGGAAS